MMSNKIQELSRLCKYGCTIYINDNLTSRETVEQYFIPVDTEDVSADVIEQAIKKNSIHMIDVFPFTAVGSYCFYHYDLDMLIDEVIDFIKQSDRYDGFTREVE